MNIHSQDTRLGKLTTSLGKDVLVLLRFSGDDHVNDLFEYTVDALSTRPNIDFDALIGTHASVELATQNNGPRQFDGIVTQARWAGVGENGNKYTLTLRPWFWLAGKRRNQRIFHNKTVVQIIEELLQPYSGLGDPALENRLTGSYPELEYTVQYRESDLDFATRLMERFGISYHFHHDAGSHTLVLTDDVGSHRPVAGGSRAYKGVDGHHQADEEHFWEWFPERNMTTGAVRLTDYNFKKPTAAMEVDHTGDAGYEQGQIESYDYPGDYLAKGEGKGVVSLRTDQERGQDHRHRAVGDCTSLGAGMTVTLTGDQVPGVKGETYLCLSASHSYVSDAYGSGGAESDGYAYSGSYVLMPVTAPLAPERKTPLPVVQGPQTAVVVGEGEIDCDEHGRILVHFHWDLEKAFSMRCRVSQNWASQGWGGMVIPRIGMEVIVEFLEGDPDKPIVTGCVYNGRNKAPYELPRHKTRSTFKTDTHQGHGFNELRFEDEKDKEEVRIIAQKDLNVLVQNCEAKIVMNDSAEAVLDNKLTEVFGNNINSVTGSMTIYTGPAGAGGMSTQGIGVQANKLSRMAYSLDRPHLKANGAPGDFTIISDGSHDISIGKSAQHYVGRNLDFDVGANFSMRITGNRSARVKGNSSENVMKNRTDFVGETYTIVCGKSRITMRRSGEIIISGTDISVDGKNISINGTQSISMKAPKIEQN